MWTNFWRDFNRENGWRFPEVAPAQLQELLGCPIVDSAERVRAEWMWQRKPRLILGAGVIGFSVVVGTAVALLLVPRIGILLDLIWLVINSVMAASVTVRFSRWIRTSDAASELLYR